MHEEEMPTEQSADMANKTEETKFFATFGQTHEIDGVGPAKDYYVEIIADNEDEAQQRMTDEYGEVWSQVYNEETFDATMFPKGKLETLRAVSTAETMDGVAEEAAPTTSAGPAASSI